MMNNKFKRMSCKYEINNKTYFRKNAIATDDDIKRCLEFCWNMTYGMTGEHRDHRTGGVKKRNLEEIFQDIFIGKMGEIAFYRWCIDRGKAKISEVDFDCFSLGEWDSSDFILTKNNRVFKVAVKTTKSFGDLLLLEVNDWIVKDNKAIYIPNQDKQGNGFYDYIVFCRVKTNLPNIIKLHNMRKDLLSLPFIKSITVELQVVGLIENQELVEIINSGKYTIYQGDTLGKSTRIDADNYYIQSGSLSLR